MSPHDGDRRQLEARLDALLCLPPAEREQALAQWEATAPQAAAALRRWLAAIERSDGFLEAAAPAAAGQAIGAWRLLRLLGQGGMGEVWLVERADGAFHKHAALKRIRGDSLPRRERFAQEREVLARLEHPGIAHLLDGGVAEDGHPFLVTEYVQGVSLDAWSTASAHGLPVRLALFRGIAEAVAYAHANLVVHRDLKPANILVDAAGRPRLLDFGIAKLLDPGSGAQTQERLLTPEFAAPEQLTGGAITTRTDVYALGALLYFLLAGQPPLAVRDLPLAALVQRVCHDVPRPPSAVAGLADVSARQLRGDLDAIVCKALAKSPADRYASVEALLADLDSAAAHRPLQARRLGAAGRMARYLRRHRWAVAASATLTLALCAGLAGTLWQARIAGHERDLARAERDAALLQVRRNNALYEFLQGLFREGVVAEERLTATEFLAHGVTWLDAHPPQDAGANALVHAVLGELQMLRRNPAGTRALLAPLLAPGAPDLPDELAARVRCVLAFAEHSDGHLDDALRLGNAGLARAAALRGSARAMVLQCRSVVGAVLADMNRDAEALAMLQLALDEAPQDDDASVLELRASLEHAYGLGLYYTGHLADAVTHDERALAIYTRLHRADSSDALSTLGNLAIALLHSGRPREADARFEQVLRASEAYGRSAGFAQRLINAAATKNVLDQPAEALALLDRAAAMQEGIVAPNAVARAQLALERAKALAALGRSDAANAQLADAEQRYVTALPAGHYSLGLVPEQRAGVLVEQGDWDAADTQLRLALAHFSPGDAAARGARCRALTLAARIALGRHDAAAARAALDEAASLSPQPANALDWQVAWRDVLASEADLILGKDPQTQARMADARERLASALGRAHSYVRYAEQRLQR